MLFTSTSSSASLPNIIMIRLYAYVYTYINIILSPGLEPWPGALAWSPGLEVLSGPCSDLPPRSLLSHPGHQRFQFFPINGTGSRPTLCPIYPCFWILDILYLVP